MMMRFIHYLMIGLFTAMWLFAGVLYAEDMRMREQEAEKKKAALIEALEHEKKQAETEARESRQRIFSDRKALTSALSELEKNIASLEAENTRLAAERDDLMLEETTLKDQLGEVDAVIRELVGHIRVNARDLDALVQQGLQSAVSAGRGEDLNRLMDKSSFPGMEDVTAMVALFFDEMRRSGEVRIEHCPIIDRSGEETAADILILGNFTAAYRSGEECGFLNFDPQDERFYAFSNLPSWHIRRRIKAYMAGESDAVPIDISRGGALRQLNHATNFSNQIAKGGPIVWPILGILVLAVVLFGERTVFLSRKKIDADKFMARLRRCISSDDWETCRSICRHQKDKPLANVISTGIDFRHMNRQDMENALQESILREIPPLERFLSTLGMLAAVAPLLGLLGTVTGMINTFHVITFFGTGDPRMMSGGISEALVTTMLGLMVAIPIMFGHTLVSRRSENMIAQMEEKAVSFMNMIYRKKEGNSDDR
ncbi:MAG: DUF3450 family protein [Desulfobacterales bacterium]